MISLRNLAITALNEAPVIVRFGFVGILSTSIHIFFAFVFISYLEDPHTSNALAFSIAFFISFIGHYFITFRTKVNIIRSSSRFFAIGLISFILNNGFLAALLATLPWPTMILVMLSVVTIPIFTFLTARLWAFKC